MFHRMTSAKSMAPAMMSGRGIHLVTVSGVICQAPHIHGHKWYSTQFNSWIDAHKCYNHLWHCSYIDVHKHYDMSHCSYIHVHKCYNIQHYSSIHIYKCYNMAAFVPTFNFYNIQHYSNIQTHNCYNMQRYSCIHRPNGGVLGIIASFMDANGMVLSRILSLMDIKNTLLSVRPTIS